MGTADLSERVALVTGGGGGVGGAIAEELAHPEATVTFTFDGPDAPTSLAAALRNAAGARRP